MFRIRLTFIITLFIICQNILAQDQFYINNNSDKYVLSFKMVNNLMVIPVEVNGKKLSFLLDTGVSNTVILNIQVVDSLKLKNIEKIKIQGLGVGEFVDAIKSTNNNIIVGKNITNKNHKIYLILEGGINLSNRIGEEIHGIIGGDLFKDFIIKINYSTKQITFYKPNTYHYKSCKKCELLPLSFIAEKPYVNVVANFSDTISVNSKLLLDTGGSDALWLFENKEAKISVPQLFFDDYLGQGLNGNIYGKRSRIKSLQIGKFELKNITASFPDTLSLSQSMRHFSRRGTIGSETLKRFYLIIDYPNKKITFKKNSKFFDEEFNYNMSGIEVAYNGQMLVSEKVIKDFQTSSGNKVSNAERGITIDYEYGYVLSLKPSIQVTDIRKNSPAELAGVQEGDYLLEVNGKPIYSYSIQDLMSLFYEKEGREIELIVDRNGYRFSFNFKLKKIL
ncbi:MAG: hypothetical protein COS42_08950 [Flavobacteriales bacterium CG03_land_8_20_14_0_80_35_15]|nr:MAG: hypothetical protein AUJ53_04200 [Flavobacteriaceae bacterium CG1_02_35_72]PIR13861.1 MAG: hypothetical protein COV50_05240 [Flavobacteriales bacterium CG11_big_fil_rev_8_21_14_0_20_35_7]PIV16646.1 MAG: hypothetical protein COS42_08950 [Flavobacteriales bacterium CG03_land_8_20_14_0_80_35_15]